MNVLQESFTSLILLPQDYKSLLKGRKQKLDILKLMIQVNKLSIEAIKAFIDKKFQEFDAQVGENLCQIRAYKILLLSKDAAFSNKDINLFLKDLILLKKRLENSFHLFENHFNKSTEYNHFLDKKETISDFFDRHNITCNLSHDFLFVIISFFLCKFSLRSENIPVAINYLKITKELEITKYAAKRIVHHYQTILTNLGCEFIFQISNEVNFNNYNKNILSSLLELSDEDRYVLPCHEATAIILQHMIEKKSFLLISIDLKKSQSIKYKKINFLFHGNNKSNRFVLFDSNKDILENISPLLVHGEAECSIDSEKQLFHFAEAFLEKGVRPILLGNTAMHPQYSGSRLISKRDNPFRELLISWSESQCTCKTELSEIKRLENQLLQHKEFALSKGCCKENSQLFFLKHIHCASYNHCKTNFLQLDDVLFINNAADFQIPRSLESIE